jgi:hypothetical protein
MLSRFTGVAAFMLLWPAMRIAAHHSFAAEYDANRPVTVDGIVTKFEWTNPHAWLYVEARDQSGTVTRWGIEMGSPGGLSRRGWTKTALKPGDHVTVQGFPAKDGRRVANSATVTMPDGRKLFGGFQTTPGAPSR